MSDERQNVILLHGLWMTGLEMSLLRWRLRRAGFRTFRFWYPSVRATVPENARRLEQFIRQRNIATPHLVCHSLGGLVGLRLMMEHQELTSQRMVALGSPFLGNFTARYLARQWPWSPLVGKCLENGLDGCGVRQSPPECQIGVIAGTASFGPAKMLRDLAKPVDMPPLPPNDGPVMVSETLLPGLTEHLTMPICHMGLVLSRPIADLTIRFLRHGTFTRMAGSPA